MNLSRCWFYTGSFDNGSSGNVTAKYNFGIDWGDGSPIEYYNSQMANSDGYLPVRHTYAKSGVHVMTIIGECDNLYQNGDTGYKDRIICLKECLWGVIVPKNRTSPLKYAHASFFGCESLVYFGKKIFENLKDCKRLFHTFDGAAIQHFHEYTLFGASNLQDIQYGFEACKMKTISANLFKWCPKITNAFHCFHRCDELTQIPKGLFDNNKLLSNVSWCFKSCTSITTVPDSLFDKCPNLTNCSYCFAGGRIAGGDLGYNKIMAITSTVPPLWDSNEMIKRWKDNGESVSQYKITSFYRYACGCEHSSNYNQAVINGWT